jgi:hypothetical protein
VKGLGLGACVSDAYSVRVSCGSLSQPVIELMCLASCGTTMVSHVTMHFTAFTHKMNIRSYNAFHYIMHECLCAYCVHLAPDTQTLLEHFASDATSAAALP